MFCTNFLSYLKQTRNLAISLFYKFRLKTTFSHYVTDRVSLVMLSLEKGALGRNF